MALELAGGGSEVSTPADYRDEHYIITDGASGWTGGHFPLDDGMVSGPSADDCFTLVGGDMVFVRPGLYAFCLSGWMSNAASADGTGSLLLEPPDEAFKYARHKFPMSTANGYQHATSDFIETITVDEWPAGNEGWKPLLTNHVAVASGDVVRLYVTTGLEEPTTVTFDFEIDIYPILFY
jgi:hypothetical protein